MKLTKEMIDRMAAWVQQNGLEVTKHLDGGVTGGAKIKTFLEAFNIPYNTFKRWSQNVTFCNSIKRACTLWKKETAGKVYNWLLKKAEGYTVTVSDSDYQAQIVREFDKDTGKKIKEYATDKGIKVREHRKDVHVAGDTAACIFLLTNLDPENWKNRRDSKNDIDLSLNDEQPPVIVFSKPQEDPPKEE